MRAAYCHTLLLVVLGVTTVTSYFDPTHTGQVPSSRTQAWLDSMLRREMRGFRSDVGIGPSRIPLGRQVVIQPSGQFYDQQVYPRPQEESFFTDRVVETSSDEDNDEEAEEAPTEHHASSLRPFFPFITVPATWQWWRGPNVCSMTEETQEEAGSDDHLSSYHFADCHDNGKRYECVNRMLSRGIKKTLRVTFECCEGYRRRRGGYCEEANLRPVEDTIKILGGEVFLSLVESAGVIDVFKRDNVTVFLPIPAAVDEYRLILQEANGISGEMSRNGQRHHGDRFERQKRRRNDDQSEERRNKRYRSNSSVQGTTMEGLRDVMSCHAADGTLEMADFIDEKVLYTDTKSTVRVNVYRDHPHGPVMTANCVPLSTQADYPASNGVVHQVQTMMKPVTKTLAEILKSDPDLSTLYNLMRKGQMHKYLEDKGQHLTLLAPNNEAFQKLDPSTLAGIEQGEACGQMILTYLTMPRSVCSAAIQGAVLGPTLLGEPMRMEKRRSRMFAGEDGARVIRRDIVATNGVMHVLNDVVMPPQAKRMSDVLREGGLSSFLTMLDEAGLLSQIDTMTNITIFAPTNEAIERLGQQTLRVMMDDPAVMREWLLYHVTQPQLRACDMPISTVLHSGVMDKGVRLKVHSPGIVGHNPMATRATAECALITQYDGQACGGVVHVIDRTLSSPDGSIVQMAMSDAELSIFNQILEMSGMAEELDSEGPWTLLAPVDSAFLRMPSDKLAEYQNNTDQAKSLVRRHVLRDVLCCTGVPESIWAPLWPLRSMDNVPVNFHRDRFRHVFAENARVTACDLTATNGVMHKLENVLDTPTPFNGGYPQYSYPTTFGFFR